jgi:septum formation protein
MHQSDTPKIILASQSRSRIDMLAAIGLNVEALPALIDEESIKLAMQAHGAKPRDIADALAEAKAVKISTKIPPALVIGCDQILLSANGELLSKAENVEAARTQLHTLSGTTHQLISAIVIAENGRPVWRHIDSAKLTMRSLSSAFIDAYLQEHWQEVSYCVGCYRIEAEGAQLFSRIEGSHFTIQGMPVLPLLDYLRTRKILPS